MISADYEIYYVAKVRAGSAVLCLSPPLMSHVRRSAELGVVLMRKDTAIARQMYLYLAVSLKSTSRAIIFYLCSYHAKGVPHEQGFAFFGGVARYY